MVCEIVEYCNEFLNEKKSFCCRKRFLFNMNNVLNIYLLYKIYVYGVFFKKFEYELLYFFFGKIVFIFFNFLLYDVKIIKFFFFFIFKYLEKSRDKCL